MPLIECENLYMSYEGVTAVRGVSFSVEEGSFLAIVGENGSGKSTLVKGILGLKGFSGGKITFNALSRTEIGYLPQQSLHQRDFPATVTEVVRSGCLNRAGLRPFYGKKEKARAADAIKSMMIDEIKHKSYRELSGGQQQRVLLARAFCAAEKLLLLDEPAAGLDPVATAELYRLIRHLNTCVGMTVIMVSHDLAAAVFYANKILHIHENGSYFGTTEEYINTPYYAAMQKEDCPYD